MPDLVHNEQLKLLATALNNLALAFVIGGFIAPEINGAATHLGPMVGWCLIGVGLHGCAQAVLRRLKP